MIRIGQSVLLLRGMETDTGTDAGVRASHDFTLGADLFRAVLFRSVGDTERYMSCTQVMENADDLWHALRALPGPQLSRLLSTLVFQVCSAFRLQSDPVFRLFAEDLIKDIPDAGAKAELRGIEKFDIGLVTVDRGVETGIGDNWLLLSEGQLGSAYVEHVHRLDFAADHKTVHYVVSWRQNQGRPTKALVFHGDRVVPLTLEAKLATDVKDFAAANGVSGLEQLSILASVDDRLCRTLDLELGKIGLPAAYQNAAHDLRFCLDAVVATDAGLLISGWLRDPKDCIVAFAAMDHSLAGRDVSKVLRMHDVTIDIDGSVFHAKRFHAFLARKPEMQYRDNVSIAIAMRDGTVSHFCIPCPDPSDRAKRMAILGTLARAATPTSLLDSTIVPSIAPLQKRICDEVSVLVDETIGVPSQCRISIIIPLYRETGFLRAQLMAFSVDPLIRDECEIIFVVDDPAIASEVRSTLRGLTYAFSLHIRLLVLSDNGGFNIANNIAASHALGEILVLMNSDVVPIRAGWLEGMRSVLADLPPFSIVGPKLLFADGAVQHAGMFFARLPFGQWQNFHYFKGYGRHYPPVDTRRPVPAVTGALMVLSKSDFLSLGGFSTDYVVADYEDSDLCLKARAKGGQCFYWPDAELYHFERQSIVDIDEERPNAIYNRALHSMIWDGAIEALRGAFPEINDA